MKFFVKKWIVVLLFFSFQFVFAQISTPDVKAKIEVEKIENMFFIRGTVENLKALYKNVSYKLTIFKTNRTNSNNSKNSQSGEVTLDPQEKVVVSKTQINEAQDDQLVILLLIYDDANVLIAKDRVELGKNEVPKSKDNMPNDGLEFMGIVSNDTKTKLGNDFFEMFYNEYSKLKLNVSNVVAVQEELTFGRTTKLLITVDRELIIEFISRPDEEFMKYMAGHSTFEVFKYFKNIEKQKKSIIQY